MSRKTATARKTAKLEGDRISAELKQLRRPDGRLVAEDVVKFAKNPRTALHRKFEWDDKKASHEYRLWQAREVIRVYITIIKRDRPPITAWVSLKSDRTAPGGGYRRTKSVLKNRERRRELLEEALEEADRWMARYRELDEFAEVFAAIERAKKRHEDEYDHDDD